jgi:flagellar motor switch protein FliN/FliY
MTNDPSPSVSRSANDYLSVWAASVCDVLGKITGSTFAAAELTAEEVGGQIGTLKGSGVWVRFKVENALKGEQSFGIAKSGAVRLAQTLVGDPLDDTREFSSDYQDALGELFRQFAGAAAVTLKPLAGGEVGLQLAGFEPATWAPERTWGVRLKNEASLEFLLIVLLDSDLVSSLAPASGGEAAQPSVHSDRPAPMRPDDAAKGSRNIDLLLGIELQVSLRFGKREMLLRDILELSAGAVVELDQKILEPVELLVGKKVVAHGEVVVMDGHYALRVTEVLNPLERIESLRE